MLAHAKLSASGAHRWMVCPGSVALEATEPDRGSPYAAEGSAAHVLLERCLHAHVDAQQFYDTEIDGFTVDDEMVESVQQVLDYVRDLGGARLIEQRVDYSPWVVGGFGTADIVIFIGDLIIVVDFKYGKGVKVYAEDNPQGMCYGLGALNDFALLGDFKRIRIVIAQPRMDHIDEWEIPVEQLFDWAETELRPAAERALSDEPVFNPGEKQCQFCRAKTTCRARAEHFLAIAIEDFEGIDGSLAPKPTDKLTNAEVATLIPHLTALTNWVKAIRAYAFDELDRGGDIPGYKLVEGKSDRAWRDPKAAEAALRKKLKVGDVFTKKLISPAQAEEKLGKTDRILKTHVVKPPGNSTLAPLSDDRPALNGNIEDDFKDVA